MVSFKDSKERSSNSTSNILEKDIKRAFTTLSNLTEGWILSILHTPYPSSLIPHGTILLKFSRFGMTLRARPCIVTHLLAVTPMAHILLCPTQTPVLTLDLSPLMLKVARVSITVCSNAFVYLHAMLCHIISLTKE